jgi:hypothetical protein
MTEIEIVIAAAGGQRAEAPTVRVISRCGIPIQLQAMFVLAFRHCDVLPISGRGVMEPIPDHLGDHLK